MSQDYFKTQRLVSTFNQEFKPEILNHHILIVGLGGNGSHIALAAARMGFKKITGIDKDLVSESNLSRQVLYTTEDLGKYKANAARKNLFRDEREALYSNIRTIATLPSNRCCAVLTINCQLSTVNCYRFCWMSPQQSPCLNCSFTSAPHLEKWFEFYKFDNGQTKIKTKEVSTIDRKISLEGGHPSIYPTACIGSNLMLSIALNYFMSRRDMPRMIEF